MSHLGSRIGRNSIVFGITCSSCKLLNCPEYISAFFQLNGLIYLFFWGELLKHTDSTGTKIRGSGCLANVRRKKLSSP